MTTLSAMSDAFIVDAVRTPIGRYGGALSGVRPDDLAATAITASLDRTKVDPAEIGDVYFGCTNGAGEDNRNVARMASLIAGLPVETPGTTVNRLCASGMEAVASGARGIKTGDAGVVLAGGVESMSRSPLVMLKPERRFPRGSSELVDSTIGWRFVNPRLAESYSTESMGETAENVAERFGISREDQDEFALNSHRRAIAAHEAGRFADELIAVATPNGSNGGEPIATDEGPRPDTSLDKLGNLRPAFRDGGTVTAGNSSQINDGATCVLLAAEERATELAPEGRPLARIVSSAVAGVDPAVMGVGPIPATRKALEKAGLTIDDMDLVELNEAFASQVLACQRELEIPLDRLNVNGGGIAIGHPLGSSGARILTTLVWEMRRRGSRYGLATMCIGVGQGMAVVIEASPNGA